MMLDGLDARNLLSQLVRSKLLTLHDYLRDLYSISLKELTGQPLNSTDWDLIKDSYSTLQFASSFPQDESYTSDADDYMSLVADVHTDPNTAHVLEEAVGDPLLIIVAVPVDGQIVLASGGTFSYYEFGQPMDDRLTDEAWREMLDAGTEPGLPSWTASFMSPSLGSTAMVLATLTKDM